MSGLGKVNNIVPILIATVVVTLSVSLLVWYNKQQPKRGEESGTPARADRGMTMDNIVVSPEDDGVRH